MKKKIAVFLLTLCSLLRAASPVSGQQPTRIPKIVYFSASSAASQLPRVESLKQGLRDLGYIESKTILVEQRYGDGKLDRAGALATEIVGLKPDVIVTGGPAATRAVKEATTKIPIVMGF